MKTQTFENKSNLPSDQNILAYFSYTTEHNKRPETTYKGPKSFFTITVEVIKFSLGPKRLLKTKVFEKKATFLVKKKFKPIFFPFIDCDKPHLKIYKGLKVTLTLTL